MITTTKTPENVTFCLLTKLISINLILIFKKNLIYVYDLQQCICIKNGITCIIIDHWYSK